MTFAYEREMRQPVADWLRKQGLMVKSEFPTPWGICDLVGCSLNKNRVRKRLRLRQTKPITSHLRVHLLSKIPEEQDSATITLEELCESFGGYLDRNRVATEVHRLIRDRFVEESSPGMYFKRNGWVPLHKRLVAVELKLARIDDALHQAINNLGFADESYVALPTETAQRLAARQRQTTSASRGIGILAVESCGCKVLVRAQKHSAGAERATQLHSAERFWRPHLRGNGA